MPVGAQGGSFKLYGITEVTENTAPASGWLQLPCFEFTPGAEMALSQDQVLSANPNRDAADPFYGKTTITGNARVPLDVANIGYWLRWLLGAPTTSGTTNKTHVFKSGGATLPSVAWEKAFPDIAKFEVLTGGRVNTMEAGISADGGADATFGLLAMKETPGTTSGAGTPTVATFTRFQRPTGSISVGGSPLASVTGGTVRFSNDMVPVDDTIRSDGLIEGIDIGQSSGSGDLTLRFKDHTLVTTANAKTPVDVRYSLTIDANTSIEFRYPRAFLQPKARAVSGPRGISQSVSFIAAYDPTLQCLMQVTLKNAQASY